MPTVLRWNACRFYFFSNEGNELAHVHVDKDGASAKLWLEKGTIARNLGFEPRELALICDKIGQEREVLLKASPFWRLGVGQPAAKSHPMIAGVTFAKDRLEVRLQDGRTVSRPLAWFPRLANASAEDRAVWEICAAGHGVHWPVIDEDLSVDGLLAGTDALSR